jgi:hypothetical protein
LTKGKSKERKKKKKGERKKVKLFIKQAVETYRVVRCLGSHIV